MVDYFGFLVDEFGIEFSDFVVVFVVGESVDDSVGGDVRVVRRNGTEV